MRDDETQSLERPASMEEANDAPRAERDGRALLDAQLALIEHRLASPFSVAQRRHLTDRLADQRSRWTGEQIAIVPDGTEPGIIFRALTPDAAAGSDQP